MVTKAKSKDLGRLNLKDKIFLGLLPEKTTRVFVSYKSAGYRYFYRGYRISCVVAPREHKIGTSRIKDSIILKTPHILVSMFCVDVPAFGKTVNAGNTIYAYNNRSRTNIWATPYMLGNVDTSGLLCLGSNPPPINLKELYKMFFYSGFASYAVNQHVGLTEFRGQKVKYFSSQKEQLKRYQSQVLDKQDWQDYTPEICGDAHWEGTGKPDGLLFTRNQRLLKKLGKDNCLKRDNTLFVAALANKIDGGWEFDTGQVKFSLADRNITVYANKHKEDKVIQLRKKYGPTCEKKPEKKLKKKIKAK